MWLNVCLAGLQGGQLLPLLPRYGRFQRIRQGKCAVRAYIVQQVRRDSLPTPHAICTVLRPALGTLYYPSTSFEVYSVGIEAETTSVIDTTGDLIMYRNNVT
ncbi:hypothetical protein K466DRAFT_340503 [Polyporus arcularius HHB13444]|uniref:Uncharacterized protein n=1 Tax=Polyporus arcularius HHB13444 TaxID=1314778 RepID=A0A5C3PP92_9APHY|nr:hypothetical protein K466DRAFT_340503 [Polyporus arcularius HHB13444]